MLKISRKEFISLLIFLSTPVIWTILVMIPVIFSELKLTPRVFSIKLDNVFLMRHAEVDTTGPVFIISKLLYNSLTIVKGEFLSFLAYFSPRFFFHAGDGTRFSPNIVEPISTMMFPFWVYGLVLSVKNKKRAILIGYLLSGLIAFMFGKREFSFLWIMLPFQVYFIYIAIAALSSNKLVRIYLGFAIIYNLFLLGRLFFMS